MDIEVIDDNILLIVKNLQLGVSDKDIIDVYTEAGFGQDDIFLLLTAAKILYQARVSAPPAKAVFRRTE